MRPKLILFLAKNPEISQQKSFDCVLLYNLKLHTKSLQQKRE